MNARNEMRLGLATKHQDVGSKSPSAGASEHPVNAPHPVQGSPCSGVPTQGFFSLRRQGALASCRIAGEPKTARLRNPGSVPPLTTRSSMRANDYLDHRPWVGQKRERAVFMPKTEAT